jgi:site-specific DNA recombinase
METTKHLKAGLTELEEKIEKLEERYVEEKITEDLYKKFAGKYGAERKKLLEELQSSPINASNLEKFIELATQRIIKPALVWNHSNYTEKQRMQR